MFRMSGVQKKECRCSEYSMFKVRVRVRVWVRVRVMVGVRVWVRVSVNTEHSEHRTF